MPIISIFLIFFYSTFQIFLGIVIELMILYMYFYPGIWQLRILPLPFCASCLTSTVNEKVIMQLNWITCYTYSASHQSASLIMLISEFQCHNFNIYCSNSIFLFLLFQHIPDWQDMFIFIQNELHIHWLFSWSLTHNGD